MTQHTPGPWHVHRRYPFWVDDADGRRVANAENYWSSPDEAKAVARLIAAAPDLLAVCEDFLANYDDPTAANWDALQSAIAKARGA